MLFCVFCGIYGVDKLVRYYELLRVHAVFGEVFHVDFAEVAKASMGGHLQPYDGWTNKFIFPPYDFTVATSLVSNFGMSV